MTDDTTRTGTMKEPSELWFTRIFDAPRELVFRCMTEPEHLTHFWGPTGVSTPLERITVDARRGGVFETVMVNDADGSEFLMRAVYDEVRRTRTALVDRGPHRHTGHLRVRRARR